MKDVLILHNINQIVQVVDDDRTFCLLGDQMGKIKIMESDGQELAILCVEGRIEQIGIFEEISSRFNSKELTDVTRVDCGGGSVLPGMADAHSHPVFSGDRVHEFAMKLAGATYMEVQAAGGGIHFTAEKTREATEEQLLEDFLEIAREMLRSGTTLLEAKSGYGLELETEVKQLRVLERATAHTPLEISATFCGAHAIPRGATEGTQTELIVQEMIPAIDKLKRSGELSNTENVDVFCEKGVFELDSTRRILEAGKAIGLRVNFHADELFPLGGAELGAEIGANAVSHLEECGPRGIGAMSRSGTVAVLLPTTAYVLRLRPPPVRQMIAAGVCVALGSDFNPNAFCYAMPTVMNLACVLFRMSMPEALVAATLHAAHSLGRGRTHGAIAVGRMADFVVLNKRNWEHLIYRMSAHQSIISYVIKNGKIVYERKQFS
ncbi:hypothetical protein niasHS_012140 [Heterodera schachtii]|uniref:Probable imidazolonepropionase n=1 Tax=Heterodera schachtii TaxID=97005 RepID=A0ABD2IFY0_HETSC